MTVYLSELAPIDLPRITYTTVDDDQAGHISEAMTLPENQARYAVDFLVIDTPEARRAAAEEWAAYEYARGAIEARDSGAFLVYSGRDNSPEALERVLEGHINSSTFAAHALVKITLKGYDATVYDLMRMYYES